MVTTIIGLFETPFEAQLVVSGLVNQGLEKTDICLVTADAASESKGQKRLFDRMRTIGVPMGKVDYYTETVCAGGALVTAKVESADAEDIHISMAEHGALETAEGDNGVTFAAGSGEDFGKTMRKPYSQGVLADDLSDELSGDLSENAKVQADRIPKAGPQIDPTADSNSPIR